MPRSATCRPWSRPPPPRSGATSPSCMPAGAVRKVFGGIAAAELGSGLDRLAARPFTENQMLEVAAKKAIAEDAAALVQDGDALIIHGGSHLLSLRPAAGQPQRAHLHQFHAAGRDPLAERHLPPDACEAAISTASRASSSSPSGAAPPEFYASKFFLGAQAITPCRHAGVPPPDRARNRTAAAARRRGDRAGRQPQVRRPGALPDHALLAHRHADHR